MKLRLGNTAIPLLLVALAIFVWRTSAALPAVVASHFASSGTANGFMPRDTYVGIMLALVIIVPLLMAVLPLAVAGQDGRNLNLPARGHWLAPERRERTLAFFRLHGQWFAAALGLFLGYVHWLVVRANAHQPPALSTSGIVTGLVVFFLFLAAWLVALYLRFRRRG